MGYEPVAQTEFGGLNLHASPDTVGEGAIDTLNVFLDPGQVKSRPGFSKFNSVAAAATLTNPFVHRRTSNTSQILAIHGATIRAFDSTGTSLTSTTEAGTLSSISYARVGTPGTERTYYTRDIGGSINALRYWDGSTFTGSVTRPAAVLAVQATDNRLVGGYGGSGAASSRVYFSEEGDPETFGADDFVTLTPGDGAVITGLANWRELLFAFKDNKYFVFYGNTVDRVGGSVFNYRAVDAGVGCGARGACHATPHGVYFVDRTGVYLTTGGEPRLVSDAITPWFRGDTLPFFGGQAISTSAFNSLTNTITLAYVHPRLFISIPGASTKVTWVYDTRTENWSYLDIPASSLAHYEKTSGTDNPTLLFSYDAAANTTSAKHLMALSTSATTDDGTAITSRWRGGFDDFELSEEKTIRQTQLWGVGTVATSISDDFGSLDTAVNVTLGTSPAIASGRRRKDKRGTLFSTQLASVSGGAWTVHRINQELRESRVVGAKTT